MIAFHEGVEHWQPRRDGLRASGRDSAQLGSLLRPSAPCGPAGGARVELPSSRDRAGRFSPGGRELGASIRAGRLWRLERRGANGPALSIERCRSRPRRDSASWQPIRLRPGRSPLGWSAPVLVPEQAPRHNPSRPAMPAAVPTNGIPAAEAATSGCFGRSAATGRTQKNSADWPETPPSICGRWMRCTSSSTAAVAGCGCRPRWPIPSATMPRPERPSATLGRFESATENCAARSPLATSMPRPAGTSFAISAESARRQAGVWSSSPTMRSTTTRPCMLSGDTSTLRAFVSISCRHTVRNSIPSNGSGSSCGAFASITDASRPWQISPPPWMRNWLSGRAPTLFSSGSAPCEPMRIYLGRRV